MASFIIRRLIASIFVLFAATFLMYILTSFAGDPLDELRQSNAPNKAELIESRTRLLNLDVPPPLRYFLWLGGIFRGDFGVSVQGQPVNALLGNAITATLTLVTTATIVAIVLGISVGIVSALRQYSGFDYFVTFLSFLFFSLPIFWVAVLLKQYGAIEINNWLADPTFAIPVIIVVSLLAGLLWMSVIGGTWKRRLIIFGISALATGAVMTYLSLTRWFSDPSIGIVVYSALAIGIAFGVTAVSTGLQNRRALYVALGIAGAGIALYYPMMTSLLNGMTLGLFVVYAVATVLVCGAVGWFLGGADRGPVVRTAALTGVLVAAFIALEKYMQYWEAYSNSSRIRGRPIATVGASTPGLGGNFWVQGIDLFTHLLLPTIAIILVSFASYTRYSRASLLEVMNQDYIRTAKAKGLTQRTVVVRHAFRNALIPITTIIAFDVGAIVGGAVITETVFGWTGMGRLFVDGLNAVDPNPVMAFFVVTGALAVLFNLVADLVYAALDPRIKVG
ncbi:MULTISPECIES: ABC transporter permease [Microbacterium]|jgi:peptide/nickel transport system permease protein|uniref:ABC transporter permease n=1 Tax=Microbacterium TaxID=33882 RepID=UPI0008D977EF|nr:MULTISPECIES: ABC transporter permease [Microbacterium]MAY49225.1 ABC transporter permease [Microbacterium sp.]HAS33072.1 ABC transporter permease [Microbacterium sp.]|tara:strand:- start:3692 stop:5209 length:1518 start_codon:yes stop_codon:yes gene_type:complete